MSTAIMKTVDVIRQCQAVIADIDRRRKQRDADRLAAEILDIEKSERGWFTRLINKLPWNKPMTREEIEKQADYNCRNCHWYTYPDDNTSEKWRQAAERLIVIAEKSHLDVMHVDDDIGGTLFDWYILPP